MKEALDQFILLFKMLPDYYSEINKRDPLFLILVSVTAVLLVTSFVFRGKPEAQLAIMTLDLLAVVTTQKISAFFESRQDLLIANKMISMRYFDIPGKFVLMVFSLPIFLVSLVTTVNLTFFIVKEMHSAKQEKKGKTQPEEASKAADVLTETDKKND